MKTLTKKIMLGITALIVIAIPIFFLATRSDITPAPQTTTSTGAGTAAGPKIPPITTTSGPQVMQIVTNASSSLNSGKAIHLGLYERFVVQLGNLNWSLAFSPAGSIVRISDSTTTDGVQGIYEAEQTGNATMTATGAPICAPGTMCPQFRQLTTVNFVIGQ